MYVSAFQVNSLLSIEKWTFFFFGFSVYEIQLSLGEKKVNMLHKRENLRYFQKSVLFKRKRRARLFGSPYREREWYVCVCQRPVIEPGSLFFIYLFFFFFTVRLVVGQTRTRLTTRAGTFFFLLLYLINSFFSLKQTKIEANIWTFQKFDNRIFSFFFKHVEIFILKSIQVLGCSGKIPLGKHVSFGQEKNTWLTSFHHWVGGGET